MAKKYVSKYAICPYYHSEEPTVVNCEGVGKGISTCVIFGNSSDADEHKRKYCRSFAYGQCPLAGILSRKYD